MNLVTFCLIGALSFLTTHGYASNNRKDYRRPAPFRVSLSRDSDSSEERSFEDNSFYNDIQADGSSRQRSIRRERCFPGYNSCGHISSLHYCHHRGYCRHRCPRGEDYNDLNLFLTEAEISKRKERCSTEDSMGGGCFDDRDCGCNKFCSCRKECIHQHRR